MSDKRYQIFVSSTYADLKEERHQVIQALIEMDCIPAGMELFPAADEEQFEFIKRVIKDCDYYLLIIGGRYGSMTAEGVSYTEKEYDFAVSIGLKVIALLHENPDEIPLGKSEKDALGRQKLDEFREKVRSGRVVKFWKSADQLPSLVTMSLVHMTKVFPAIGWVRANKVAGIDALTELNELRKTNAQLQSALGKLKPSVENLAGLDDKFELYGTARHARYSGSGYYTQTWKAVYTWREIFGCIAPYLESFPTDENVKSILMQDAFARSHDGGQYPDLNDQLFRTVALQLKALTLVSTQYSQTVAGSMALFWSLTPLGEKTLMEIRTVRRSEPPKAAPA